MRAFFSILLTLSFLSLAIVLININQKLTTSLHAARLQLLQHEAFFGHEVEIKRAIIDVLSLTNTYAEIVLDIAKERITIDDKLLFIGGQLIFFEPLLEKAFNKTHGISVDLWCGAISETEKRTLLKEIANGKTKCTNCYDWTHISFYKGKPTSICASAIIIDLVTGDLRIAEDPNLLFVMPLPGRGFSFGASIYDQKKNIASVVVIPTGVVIK